MNNKDIQLVLMVVGIICTLGSLLLSMIINDATYFVFGYPIGVVIFIIVTFIRRRV
jgi:predicted MFS family arabinose efflux permease